LLGPILPQDAPGCGCEVASVASVAAGAWIEKKVVFHTELAYNYTVWVVSIPLTNDGVRQLG